MKCANCESDSLFEYKLTQEVSIFYCGKHIPKFLEARKKAGLLHTTEKFGSSKVESAELLKTEEPVTDEESATEVSSEEEQPKPKKKAAKKKAE